MSTDDIDTTTGIDDLDMIDDLPISARPALAAVSTQCIAEHAALEGMIIARHRPGDPARAAEEAHAEVASLAARVMPSREDDETPDSWYRRGVHDGIMCAWERRVFSPPTIPMSDLELYTSGYAHACSVVLRVVQEGARHGR